MKLSAVILVKNEENNVIDCIDSLSFCDEIIVIDDFSTDRTLEVIKNLENKKIRIFKRSLDGNFASQRNFALEKATGDWVFFIDADERLSPGLKGEIEQVLADGTSKKGYFIKRTDFMWGKQLKYGETANVKLIRFAKNEPKNNWRGKVHEVWNVEGEIGNFMYPLYHYPHQTVKEFIEEINVYTSFRAKELFERGNKTNLFYIIAYPKTKFILNYFIRKGYRDGTQGFVVAMLMSLHSFLVRGKLYLLMKKNNVR